MAASQRPDLLAYLDQLVEELRDGVPAALRGEDVDAIHDARVATRRLSAALSLYSECLTEKTRKAFARALKRLRRDLGGLRDADVMIQHLGVLARRKRLAAPANWLMQRIQAERATTLHDADTRPAAVLAKLGQWWGVRREMEEAAQALPTLLREGVATGMADFARRADALSAADDQALGSEPADPHELRIAGKRLRYTLEMARKSGHALPAELLKPFKKLQDRLGLWHDYAVLVQAVLEHALDAELAVGNAAVLREVLLLAQECSRFAQREIEFFKVVWIECGPGIVRAVTEAFEGPALSNVADMSLADQAGDLSESQMDRDLPSTTQIPPPEVSH